TAVTPDIEIQPPFFPGGGDDLVPFNLPGGLGFRSTTGTAENRNSKQENQKHKTNTPYSIHECIPCNDARLNDLRIQTDGFLICRLSFSSFRRKRGLIVTPVKTGVHPSRPFNLDTVFQRYDELSLCLKVRDFNHPR